MFVLSSWRLSVASRGEFACLNYHAIGDSINQYSVSEKQLRDHLAFLKAEAYTVDGFEQLEHRLRSDRRLPGRYVVVTVDDGFESAIRAADVFAEYGSQATFFVTRDRCLKEPGFIREPEIQELRRRGFSLGTHGTTHHKLTHMPAQHCIDELKDSKKWLEDVIGEKVRYMAAPGGFINSGVMKLAHEHGYVLTGTCNEWMNSTKTITPRGKVNRVNVRRQFSSKLFRYIVEGYPRFYIWRQVRAAVYWFPKQLLLG